MMYRVPLLAALAVCSLAPLPTAAAELPAIRTSERNAVPECVTPGRLMAFLRARNDNLEPRFEKIAVHYMRYGEELGLRWDYAFVQMVIETGYLTFKRDGKYDAGDEGPIKGKYWVVVGGMDQSKNKVDSDGVTVTAPLFNHYRFAVEIPTPNNTLDIEVPASQKIKRTK